jgi:hypothetical protein
MSAALEKAYYPGAHDIVIAVERVLADKAKVRSTKVPALFREVNAAD